MQSHGLIGAREAQIRSFRVTSATGMPTHTLARTLSEAYVVTGLKWKLLGSLGVAMELGKLLVIFGAMLVVAGVAVMLLGRMNIPLGRLPGDFFIAGRHTTVYFPLATSLVVSLVLSILLYAVSRRLG